MDIQQLATMVKAMRAAQQMYFRQRTSDKLTEAVKQEAAVDRAVEQILGSKPAQSSLFSTPDLGGSKL